MTGYVRQSSASILPNEEITAGPLNNEFDRLEDAFNASTGHTHDGSTGEGQKIVLTTSVTGVLPQLNGGTGSNDGTISFTTITATTGFVGPQIVSDDSDSQIIVSGDTTTSTGANLVLYGGSHSTTAGDFLLRDGTTNVIQYDKSAGELNLLSTTNITTGVITTGTITSLTSTTVDINGGTIDGTTIGSTSASDGTFTSLTSTSLSVSGTSTLTTVDINGGTIDGTTLNNNTIDNCIIGATTPVAGSFTDLSGSGTLSFTNNLNMNSNKITNLAAPTSDNDAVRKTDLDSASIYFKANKNGTNQDGDSGDKITFSNEVLDTGNYYDTTNSRFTPPAGAYHLVAQLGHGVDDGEDFIVQIYKNGSEIARSVHSRTPYILINQTTSVMVVEEANGTDYFEVYYSGTSSGSYTIVGNVERTFFYGYKI